MKLATKILAALTISAASISAYAGWERLDETRTWNTDRVQISGNNRTVFLKNTEPGKTPKGKRYASVIVSSTINCESLSMRFNSMVFYDRNQNDVDFVQLPAYADEIPAYPDTFGERFAQTVCAWSGGGHGDVSSAPASARKASPGYADRVRRRVTPNIVYTGDVGGNPAAVVSVSLAPDGSLLSARLAKSSGDSDWDNAVLRAMERSDPLPRDENGKAPANFTITFRPKN